MLHLAQVGTLVSNIFNDNIMFSFIRAQVTRSKYSSVKSF